MKRIAIFLVVTVLFPFVAPTFATLGPIRVELNLIKPKISAARANSLTAFKIYMRYNVNIKYRQWIKVWFPINESGLSGIPDEIPTKVCDGLGVIDGDNTSYRFIPGEEFFKKFPDSKAKENGLLYDIKDYKGNTEFFPLPDLNKFKPWQDVYGNDKSPRLVKDPSGLGCWLLGTTLPPMPLDTKTRMERLQTVMRSVSIGYSPCDCLYPILINSPKECSFTHIMEMELEAWRKGYNSIDINTSKTTGIIAPATPGRYFVSVATEPEPEPVESEAFVLPCSDVSDVKLETTNLTDPDSFLSVKFRTGEGGALDERGSAISLKFPKNVVFPKTILSKSIKVNGKLGDWFAPTTINVDTSNKDFNIIKFPSYSDVENMSVCSVDFTSSSQIQLPKDGKPITVEVATSSEPNFVASQPTVCQLETRLVLITPQEFDYSSLCLLIPIQGQTLKAGTEVSVIFPDGFILPKSTTSSGIFINSSSVYGKFQPTDRTLKFKLPNTISNTLSIQIKPNSGLQNPSAGSYEVSLQIQKQTLDFKFEIIAADALIRNLSYISLWEDDVKFEFDFKTSSANPLQTDDWLIFSIQGEFTKTESNRITFNGKRANEAEIIDGTIKAILPTDIDSKSFVHVTIDANCKKPRDSNKDWITIETSKGDSAASEEFTWYR